MARIIRAFLSLVILIGLASLAACAAPTSQPEPTLTPTPTLAPPTPQPPEEQPTEVIGIAVPVEEPSPSPVTPIATPPALALLPGACDLLSIEEVAAVFPNPPAPQSEEQVADDFMGSRCFYKGETMEMVINISLLNVNLEAWDILQNLDKFPVKFQESGAQVYLVGGPDDSGAGQLFNGIIEKDNVIVLVVGGGTAYQYEEQTVSALLRIISSRLPELAPPPPPPVACGLVTMDEVAARFPDPPAPISEESADPYGSSCTYQREDEGFIIILAESPDFVREMLANTFAEISDSFTLLTITGAEVYLTGGPRRVEGTGDVFIALIQKGNYGVYLTAGGGSYSYDLTREIALLEAVVGRLP